MATRVPAKDSEFDQYIRNTTAALLVAGPPTGWERLGLTAGEKDQWVAFHDTWVDIYPKTTDPAQRTSSITQDKNQLKKEFLAFASPLLNKVAVSENLTSKDRLTFHIAAPVRTLTPRATIEDVPIVGVQSIGGGKLQFRVRVSEDANRASRHSQSDAIEVKTCVVDPADGNAKRPVSVKDCHENYISSKAIFNFNAGEANNGKRIYFYVRWINLSNPTKNGPWTEQMRTVIV